MKSRAQTRKEIIEFFCREELASGISIQDYADKVEWDKRTVQTYFKSLNDDGILTRKLKKHSGSIQWYVYFLSKKSKKLLESKNAADG
jgi:predicted transcriptional regulator